MPTAAFSRLPVADLVARTRSLFTAARDDADIAPLLAEVGYDADALTDALALVAEVDAAERTQKAEYAEQYEATRAVAHATEALRVPYVRHVRLARVVFDKGTRGYDALALAGTRADKGADLVAEARAFYETVRTDAALAAPLARVKLTPAVAAEQLARVAALDAARTAQQVESGQAQQATRARDVAEARLRALAADVAEVAKIALADHPQLRERLGLLER